MSKAIRFGIVAALAVASSPAWAGDEYTSDTPSSSESTSGDETKTADEKASATGIVVEPASGSAMPRESKEVRASFEERWLRDREGFRDGGY
jgi:hypothetical protein